MFARPSPKPDLPLRPQKILLIRPRYIGDVLLSSPLIRALRTAFPNAVLDYLTTAPCAEMLHENPHLDHVLPYPLHHRPWTYLEGTGKLFAKKYDVVIDLEGARVTARMTWFSRAPIRIGYASSTAGWAYTHKVPEPDNRLYWVQAQAELLRPLGVSLGSNKMELFLNEADRTRGERILKQLGVNSGDPFVALTPGSAHRYNVWPADRFAQLADHLAERWDMRTVLLFGPGQEGFVAAVRGAMRHSTQCGIAATPTMRDAAAVLERSVMYIGTDTGTRHLAIALGVPTVGVFGRQFPERWTPPEAQDHLTAEHNPGCKAQCHHRTCEHLSCIRGIPVSEVLQRVEYVLARRLLEAPVFTPPSSLGQTIPQRAE